MILPWTRGDPDALHIRFRADVLPIIVIIVIGLTLADSRARLSALRVVEYYTRTARGAE